MSEDLLLRLAALAAFLGTAIVAGVFRGRAARAGGPLPAVRPPGQPPVAVRAAALAAIVGTLLVSAVAPGRVPWLILSLPGWLRWVGLGLAAAAVPLIWWVMRSIGAGVSESIATRAGARLATGGPYRYVRHPLYTTGTLMYLGLALALQSLGLLLIVAGIVIWLPGRARREEAHLVASYGDDYRRYMAATGRFLPRRS